MEFRLNKKEVIFTALAIIAMVQFLHFILNFGEGKSILIIVGLIVFFTYKTINKKSDVYEIKDDILIIKKSNTHIPLKKIHEINVRKAEFFYYAGITSESKGFRFFVKYNEIEYELLTTCKNENGRTLNEILNKEYNIDYILEL